MRFFEFNRAAYYALICAKNEEEAYISYVEEVGDLEETDSKEFDELSKEEVIKKIMNADGTEEERQENLKMLNENTEAFVVLIDCSLI